MTGLDQARPKRVQALASSGLAGLASAPVLLTADRAAAIHLERIAAGAILAPLPNGGFLALGSE
jgi:hypothetical protein